MLTFNALLRHEGVDPAGVRLVRHQDTRRPGRPTPYELWRSKDGRLERYQSLQKPGRFDIGDVLASFVGTPSGDTLFVGIYRVIAEGPVPNGLRDPIYPEQDLSGHRYFDIQRESALSEYEGRLTIDWGRGYLAWVQRAAKRDKPVLEIRTAFHEPPFPGFTNFVWNLPDIATVYPSWQNILKEVRGVYLLACLETGKLYVGSAKGEESLWGRWVQHANCEFGDAVELRKRARTTYQVTVLEIVNSDIGIEALENAWKQKLLSRQFGLNKN